MYFAYLIIFGIYNLKIKKESDPYLITSKLFRNNIFEKLKYLIIKT